MVKKPGKWLETAVFTCLEVVKKSILSIVEENSSSEIITIAFFERE